ncbi:MAG: NADPH-dependent glutamate synthase [Muribaculaceae bacterium]|nr:NADPH-dependent glutamate synthase [Muribaculaceae bacterium]
MELDKKRDISELTSRDATWRRELRDAMPAAQRTALPRATMNELDPAYRVTCNEEVAQGLTLEQALGEATRCLDCPNPGCVTGCPVGIDIPSFVKNIQRGDINGASRVLRLTSALPAVCGRVCPQERQCESKCIYNKMHRAPVGIGWLERYAADHASKVEVEKAPSNGKKIAVVGSGPAGLSFAGSMIARGYQVTVFEALHQIGGVLKYGIPEFRLPNDIVDREIEMLEESGVTFVKDVVIGKTISYDQLVEDGYVGVFVASGAGLPRFMGIEGENLIGVMSSNEFLTRVNLMGAGRPGYATPVRRGKVVAVIGGGNTAMDSVRTALRMGAERAIIVYRRGKEEMPARAEEIHHATQEGVEFMTLHNPVAYRGNERGEVTSMLLQKMELGEPDASGRRSPQPVPGAIVEVPVDEVIVSIGVSPNPIVPNSISGLNVSKRGTIEVNDDLQSSIATLYAGGDIVRGGATVILAMGDGRHAAEAMHRALS